MPAVAALSERREKRRSETAATTDVVTSFSAFVLERDISAVLLTIDGRKAPVPVAFGEPGEEAVLGATTLEALGFVVDPVAKKLVPRDLLALVQRSILNQSEREQKFVELLTKVQD